MIAWLLSQNDLTARDFGDKEDDIPVYIVIEWTKIQVVYKVIKSVWRNRIS
jgi:hypothetical protein